LLPGRVLIFQSGSQGRSPRGVRGGAPMDLFGLTHVLPSSPFAHPDSRTVRCQPMNHVSFGVASLLQLLLQRFQLAPQLRRVQLFVLNAEILLGRFCDLPGGQQPLLGRAGLLVYPFDPPIDSRLVSQFDGW